MIEFTRAAQEAVHLKGFMEELQLDSGKPIELAVDNTAARDTAYNPEHHQKVKHIERRHFYVRECVEDHKITVPYVNTLDNLSEARGRICGGVLRDGSVGRTCMMHVHVLASSWCFQEGLGT